MSKSLYAANGAASDEVETVENVPGVFTPVAIVEPEDGTAIEFSNTGTAGGAKAGIPLFADLKSADGVDMAPDTEVVLAYKQPGDDNWQHVSATRSNINDYINHDLAEQQSDDKVDTFKIPFEDSQGWRVLDVDQFAVLVRSDDVIDHSVSTLQFEPSYVETRSINR